MQPREGLARSTVNHIPKCVKSPVRFNSLRNKQYSTLDGWAEAALLER